MKRAFIEIQVPSGVWQRFTECNAHPANLKTMLDAALRSQSWVTKARALDTQTGQILDMAFK
ncbi:MAG: hypothetical protein GX049_06875 [Alcaligenaceae bacterium]|nr:hypothetical protein [Alcaligenaceae bacterium]